jgi:hypothetical protein
MRHTTWVWRGHTRSVAIVTDTFTFVLVMCVKFSGEERGQRSSKLLDSKALHLHQLLLSPLVLAGRELCFEENCVDNPLPPE